MPPRNKFRSKSSNRRSRKNVHKIRKSKRRKTVRRVNKTKRRMRGGAVTRRSTGELVEVVRMAMEKTRDIFVTSPFSISKIKSKLFLSISLTLVLMVTKLYFT